MAKLPGALRQRLGHLRRVWGCWTCSRFGLSHLNTLCNAALLPFTCFLQRKGIARRCCCCCFAAILLLSSRGVLCSMQP